MPTGNNSDENIALSPEIDIAYKYIQEACLVILGYEFCCEKCNTALSESVLKASLKVEAQKHCANRHSW